MSIPSLHQHLHAILCHWYLLSYFSVIPSRQNLEVWQQGARLQHFTVSAAVLQWLAKRNVLLQRGILDPGLLGSIGH